VISVTRWQRAIHIWFYALTPLKESVKLITNVEALNDYYLVIP
jgi:hypothetical protein